MREACASGRRCAAQTPGLCRPCLGRAHGYSSRSGSPAVSERSRRRKCSTTNGAGRRCLARDLVHGAEATLRAQRRKASFSSRNRAQEAGHCLRCLKIGRHTVSRAPVAPGQICPPQNVNMPSDRIRSLGQYAPAFPSICPLYARICGPRTINMPHMRAHTRAGSRGVNMSNNMRPWLLTLAQSVHQPTSRLL
jgi:hypothetical protein